MGKYDSAAQTALALIRRKGGTAIITRRTASSFDPVTQAESATEVQHTFPALGLPPGRSASFVLGSLEGKTVEEMYFAQAGQSITPQPGDEVLWKNVNWRLEWCDTYAPAADGSILTKAYAVR